ncbi:MAG: hypothetical protein JRH01_14785 [Deltaproteobacteria bacterium]|nr:hypothetical protein [Deltaproteobacteria bacterium]MBW2395144.1 hypothetical protein [Deltaproteobacteria bacterium]
MAAVRDRYQGMFFVRRDRPLNLCPEALRSLQLSLNTPVVRVEDLPVAPARAVLVLHTGSTDPLDVTLSVRSLKSGQVLHFAPSEGLSDAAGCIDAAMSFGEGMGFLFDDDELAVGDAERAYGIWAELMGDLPTQPPVEAPAAPVQAVEEPSFKFVDEEDPDEMELLLVEAIDEATVDEPVTEGPSELALEAPPAPVASVEPSHGVSPPPDTTALASMVEDALAADEAPVLAETEAIEPTAPMLTKFRPASPAAVIEPERAEIVLSDISEPQGEDGIEPAIESDEPATLETDAEVEEPLFEGDGLGAEPSASADPARVVNAPEVDEISPECAPTEDDTPVLHAADSDRLEAPAVPKGRRLRKAALGRLRLVKKRKPASDEDRRKWLARILSTF